jgi:hypothetical protein
MLLSLAPLSSAPLSSNSAPSIRGSIALAPATPTILITEAEDFIGAIALAPAVPVFSLTASWFFASIALTQQAASINLSSYNGIAPWQAAPVDNTRRRQQSPTLQEIRTTAPTLKQIRQSLPMLGD